MSGEPRNLADLVRWAADEAGDRDALRSPAGTLSWRELDAAVDSVAAGLRSMVGGELVPAAPARVGLLLGNRLEFAIAYFAILRAGLTAVPLNTAYTTAELDYQLTDADIALVVTEGSRAALVGERATLLVDSPQWEALLSGGGGAVEASSGDEDLAVLLYTSGTTGRPKGAMLTHRALLANLEQLAQIEPKVVASDDVVLLVLPLFHIYGLNSGLGMTAYVGATGVLADRFDPVETLALVRREQVTNIIGAPPMYVAWSMLPELADSLSALRVAVSGAAPLPPTALKAVLETTGHQVFEGYGLTETAPVLTTTLCSPTAKPGSIGRPIPGVELRLVDESGDEVEEDDPGEIVVRGPNVFAGYWPDGHGGVDGEGWFRTGDVAYADTDGDLFIVDRTRELILVSGFNVYPREVEAAIESHPDVAEVAVIGVPHPYTGETVRALVVVRDGAKPDAAAIIDHAAARLARFKCPTSVEFVDELPHSVAGKVAKGKLRAS